jgi:hypothetical protein
MALDLARAGSPPSGTLGGDPDHSPRVHRDDLLVEAGKAALVLGDQLWIEARQPVARHLQIERAGAGQHRLGAVAVAAVRPPVGLPGLKVMVHLRVQHPLGQGLFQTVQQAALGQGRAGIRSGQELIQNLIGDRRRFAARHAAAPSAPAYGPKPNPGIRPSFPLCSSHDQRTEPHPDDGSHPAGRRSRTMMRSGLRRTAAT